MAFLIGKSIGPARARNAAVLNQFATPGLGSLMCGRWIAGLGQLALCVTGFIMILIWFFQEMSVYYGMMFSDAATTAPGFTLLKWGAALFAASWIWSLVTSVQLLFQAERDKTPPKNIPPKL